MPPDSLIDKPLGTGRPGCSEASACSCMEPAGAVGQALLALGRLAGLELWGTARGSRRPDPRAGRYADQLQREDFTRVLPGGFDVVFDGIGGRH